MDLFSQCTLKPIVILPPEGNCSLGKYILNMEKDASPVSVLVYSVPSTNDTVDEKIDEASFVRGLYARILAMQTDEYMLADRQPKVMIRTLERESKSEGIVRGAFDFHETGYVPRTLLKKDIFVRSLERVGRRRCALQRANVELNRSMFSVSQEI
jgi:hypothetical protein